MTGHGFYTPFQLDSEATLEHAPEWQKKRRITTPSLLIFLGSTPALAALEVQRQLLTHIDKDRKRVAMVFIDTDTVPNDLLKFRREHTGMFKEIDLRISVPPGVEFASMPNFPLHTFMPHKIPKYYANGAGGIRNNGHVAAAFNYIRLQQAIESGLLEIENIDTESDAERVHEVQCNIITFLGGGTGSGIVNDVALICRQMLSNRHYTQRINIFCMLPEAVKGSTQVDVSWRQSNTTATLLEMVATSIVAKSRNQLYQRYMLHRAYDVGDQNPLANEVYLVGYTSLGTVEDAARVVGLDLYQRVVDASGVGKLENSKWMDRRNLGNYDDRGLPRFFGATCPLDVRFPALETAEAFALISSAYLLPYLVPSSKPTEDVPSGTQVEEWQAKWTRAGAVIDTMGDTEQDRFGIQRPNLFRQDDFVPPVSGTVRQRHQEYDEAIRRVNESLRERTKAFRFQEEQRVNFTPPPDQTDTAPIIGRRIRYLHALRQEYTTIQRQLEQEDTDDPANEWGNDALQSAEDEVLRVDTWPTWLPLPGDLPSFVTEPKVRKRIDDLVSKLNHNIGTHPIFERRRLMIDVVDRLVKQVDAELQKRGNGSMAASSATPLIPWRARAGRIPPGKAR